MLFVRQVISFTRGTRTGVAARSGIRARTFQRHLVQQDAAVCIDGLLLRVKRGRRLAALAKADPIVDAGREVVEDDDVLAVAAAAFAQRLQAEGNADHPAEAADAGVTAGQRHGADDLSDAHGRPAPEEFPRRPPGTPARGSRTPSAGSAAPRRTSAP